MQTFNITRIALVFAISAACAPAQSGAPAPETKAEAVIGAPAPAFTLTDSLGKSQSLTQYAGKWVVLEWVNYDCPFVKKHYNSGNMQSLQKDATGKGVVWLSVNSSAPGKQGNFAPDVIASRSSKHGAGFSAYLLDPTGATGRAYGAKTTPHMYVIDPKGTLVYAGGIDDRPTTDEDDINGARNYVRAALDEGMAGKAVTTATAMPYGCNVKY